MKLREYLSLFSNQGNIEVRVNLKGSNGIVSTRKMTPSEISCLITEDGESFVKNLTIDEWPVEVQKYEINPSKNTLIIHAII